MKIVDELRRDHRLIDEIAGSLNRWANRGTDHEEAEGDRRDLVRFLRTFLLEHHHRTEEVLFDALIEHAEIPGHRGPIAILRREHDRAAAMVDRFAALDGGDEAGEAAQALAAELWQHVDKEESVFLLEVERRLVDGGVRHVEVPPISDDVETVRDLGAELVRRLPPLDDFEVVRGDGCIPCEAFATECHGIEAEWWSDWERLHHAGLDEG